MMMKTNPVAKLFCNVSGVVLSFMVFDIPRLKAILAAALLIGALEGNFNVRSLKKTSPLLLFGLGVFMTNLLWGSGSFDPSLANLELAVKLFLRIAIVGALATGFLFNINPNEMLLGLMQNLKLNPGIAYGIMVAFRFFPMMEEDMVMIKSARAIRMGDKRKGLNEYLSMPVPLLAANVRRAEKVAIAMEARGFDRFASRTAFRSVPWKTWDTIYLAAVIGLFTGIYFII